MTLTPIVFATSVWRIITKETIYGEHIPTGIRNGNGYVCHFNEIQHWEGQDQRYTEECSERRKHAEIMCAALNREAR